MQYQDPRLLVARTPLGTLRKLPSPKSNAAAPFYERPWRLKVEVPSDPAECDCVDRCQSELMHLLKTLESYQLDR